MSDPEIAPAVDDCGSPPGEAVHSKLESAQGALLSPALRAEEQKVAPHRPPTPPRAPRAAPAAAGGGDGSVQSPASRSEEGTLAGGGDAIAAARQAEAAATSPHSAPAGDPPCSPAPAPEDGDDGGCRTARSGTSPCNSVPQSPPRPAAAALHRPPPAHGKRPFSGQYALRASRGVPGTDPEEDPLWVEQDGGDTVRLLGNVPIPADDYWEYRSESGEVPATNFSALANLTNCILDAGILGVPYVMAQAGFIGGFVLIVAAACISSYTIELLISVAHRACSEQLISCVAYEELGELAGGKRKGWGIWGRNTVLIFVFIYCIGALIGYVVVVRDNLSTGFAGLLGSDAGQWVRDMGKVPFAGIACLLILLPLCAQRDVSSIGHISALTPTVVVAIIAIFLVEQVTKGTDLCDQQQPPCKIPYTTTFTSDAPAMTGLCIFAFLCHHNSFQVYRTLGATATPEGFRPIVRGSIAFAAIASMAMGVVVYATFGTSTKDDIFLNYPSDNSAVNAARMLMAINMLLSFPMNFLAAREVVQVLVEDTPGERTQAPPISPLRKLPKQLSSKAFSQPALRHTIDSLAPSRLSVLVSNEGKDPEAPASHPVSPIPDPGASPQGPQKGSPPQHGPSPGALRIEPGSHSSVKKGGLSGAQQSRALLRSEPGQPESLPTPGAPATLREEPGRGGSFRRTWRNSGWDAFLSFGSSRRSPDPGRHSMGLSSAGRTYGGRRAVSTAFSASGLPQTRVWSTLTRPPPAEAVSAAGGGVRNLTDDRLHISSTGILFVITIAAGLFSPSLGNVLTLVGGVAGSVLAFILPGAIALAVEERPYGGRAACWGMVLFGAGAAILTVVTVALGQG
eukprot:TRINITY_DN7890_c0_g3_i1.p1 TRINITY_DN7890_c0_g3~~TRINITY_DN7890_c0_g3_i1.p1  ORF type:complete len:883 (+),score=201.15 TRINITY_DN7890_c0_g3_i1:96-2651(+)